MRNIVCRRTEPIEVQDLNNLTQEVGSDVSEKPVLEIVTSVTTAVVCSRPGPPRQPPLPGYDDDFDYEYGGPPVMPPQPYRNDHDDAKIINVEETVMIINSAPLINALQAVVSYYPGRKYICLVQTIDDKY